MKRPLLLLMAAVLFLSGCWSRIEVNDLAIVGIIALDREENGELRLSLQIVNPQRITRPGGQGGGGGKRPFLVVSSTGPTVLEAFRKLQLQLPRRIFLAHANVVLLGEELAKSGLQPVEDFLARYRELRPTSMLLVTDGRALDIADAQPELERSPSENIAELLRTRVGVAMPLHQYFQDRRQGGIDPVLPWLGLAPVAPGRQAETGGPNFILKGGAFFVDDRLTGWLSPREMRVVMAMRGRTTVGILTTPLRDESDSNRWYNPELDRTSPSHKVSWRQGEPNIALRLKMELVVQSVPADMDLRDPSMLHRLERVVEQDTAQRFRDAFEKSRAQGSDPFGFGLMIRNSSPAAWRRLAPNWRERIRQLAVTIDVEAHLIGAGRTNRTLTIPQGDDPP